MPTWVRWNTSKWHATAPGIWTDHTRCGQVITVPDRDVFDLSQTALPDDDYGVCLHCLRSLEMASRLDEANSTLTAVNPGGGHSS
jgi:hypothetical protein